MAVRELEQELLDEMSDDLRVLMLKNGIRQQDVAEYFKIDRLPVYHAISGKGTLKNLNRIKGLVERMLEDGYVPKRENKKRKG
jgi:hypothetical protein